jgi:alcohol dehydrogenase class IV
MHFHFSLPSSVTFAQGNAQTVGHLVLGLELKKVFCVYDSGIKKAGIADSIVAALKAAKLEVVEWGSLVANPSDVVVEEGAKLARAAEAEVIVAVGGGSVIDAGKAIAILMTNESPINQYEGINLVKNPGIPVIAVPTTAGTASEVTAFTVVTDTARQTKMVVGGQNVGPRFALLDPLLTTGMPPELTASTGMGAFAHAVEAYLSAAASVATDINALKAIELIYRNLPIAVEDGANADARANMLVGSMLAGFAYNSAILGLAHSISHPLNVHGGLPHGIANAAVLPHVMEYNGVAVPEKLRAVGTAMGLELQGLDREEAVRQTVDAVKGLSRQIGIPSLREAGVSRDAFDRIASDALQEISTIFNPRKPGKDDVIALLEKAY